MADEATEHPPPPGSPLRAPRLTNAQAWDVAAFVNAQPRPHLAAPHDWPDIHQKPVDHPLRPCADAFSERQHKFGPYQPIEDAHPAPAH